MANKETVTITLKTVADISDVVSNAKQIQNVLGQLKLPDALKAQFTKTFDGIEKSAEKASQAMQNGFKTKGDVNSFNQNMEKINNLLLQLQTNMKKIPSDVFKESFEMDPSKIETFNRNIKDLQAQLAKIRSDGLQDVDAAVQKISQHSQAKSINKFFEAFKAGDIQEAEKALRGLELGLKNMNDNTDSKKLKDYSEAVEVFKKRLSEIGDSSGAVKTIETAIEQLTDEFQLAKEQGAKELKGSIDDLNSGPIPVMTEQTKEMGHTMSNTASQTQRLGSEIDQFKNKIQYFFGLNNAVNLFKRAVNSAFETVKDLDKVMTETAVVTNFSVGDMWSQLPEYTKRANELGVSIHSAYESATIYYQQGLKTNEVMAVSNATLKMARIAGLEAADATDRMTNALRGFNMEINETNADRIADVYSKLAAMSASNVDEISTAMTKVASLASSANMEFETTAAFLSQIVETTRERAETAGTALKTIIARFSEVKALYSQGQLLGTDSEGEAIDVNKVSTALRTAGINLNEFLTGTKGLDDVFMDLASRWNDLDIVQQRYIATMAAGSRQQSRFIAMMSDYKRTQELVNAANNASGASNEQYAKTLESLETKLTQLKNAWDTFLMGIANDSLIKAGVDALTGLVTILNDLTSSLPGLAGSLSKVVLAIAGFKIGKTIFNKVFANIGAQLRGEATKSGASSAQAWITGFKKNIQNNGTLKGAFKTLFTKELDPDTVLSFDKQAFNKQLGKLFKDSQLDNNQLITIRTIYAEEGYEAAKLKAEEYGVKLNELKGKTEDFTKNSELNFNSLAVAAGILGAAFMGVASILENNGAEDAAKVFKVLGGAMMGVATILPLISMGAKAMGLSLTTAGIQGTIAGKAVNLAWWPVTLVLLAVVAAVALLVIGFTALANSTPEAKLKQAEEAAQAAADAAQNAADAYNNLNDSWNNLNDKYSTLENMTKGTQEWRNAVQEINSAVLDLMDNYKGLIITTDKNGILHIDEASMENALNKYEENSLKASSASIVAQQKVLEAKNKVNYTNLSNGLFDAQGAQAGRWVRTGNQSFWMGDQKGTEDIARNIASGKLIGSLQIEQYAKSMGLLISTTEDDIKALRDFGNQLLESDVQMESYYVAMAANAQAMADIPDAMNEYANNFLSSDRMDTIQQKALQKQQETKDINNKREKYAEMMGYNDYAAYKEANNNKDISDSDLNAALAAADATEKAASSIEKFTKNLNKLPDFVQKIYKQNEGKALNKSDIEKLANVKSYNDIIGKSTEEVLSSLNENKIKEQYALLNDQKIEDIDTESDDFKLFIQEYVDAIVLATNAYEQSVQKLEFISEDLIGKFDRYQLSSGIEEGIADNLVRIFEVSGQEAALIMSNYINAVLDNASDVDMAAQALADMDWYNITDINMLKSILSEVDINWDAVSSATNGAVTGVNDLTEQINNLAKAVFNVDLNSYSASLQKVVDVIKGIQTGEITSSIFSDEIYKALIQQGADESDFIPNKTFDEEGKIVTTWTYIGASLNELPDKIIEATDNKIARTHAQEEEAKLIKNLMNNGWEYGQNPTGYGPGPYKGEHHDFDSSLGDIDSIKDFLFAYAATSKNPQVTQLSEDELKKIKDAGDEDFIYLVDLANKIIDYSNSTSGITDALITGLAQILSPEQLAIKAIEGGEGYDTYYGAFMNQVANAPVPQEILNKLTDMINNGSLGEKNSALIQLGEITEAYTEASQLGLNTDEMAAYAKSLQDVNAGLSDVTAAQVALANSKLNAGLKEIIDSYDDWTALINESTGLIETSSSDDAKAFNELKKSVNKMLNTSQDLSDTFWNTAENIELVKKAAEGDVEALGELQVAAAQDYLLNIEVPDIDGTAREALENLSNYIADYEFPKLNPGDILDKQDFIDDCNDLIAASNMTAEQISEAYKAMGFDVELEYVKDTRVVPGSITRREPIEFDDAGNAIAWKEYTTPAEPTEMEGWFPKLRTLTSTGSGGGGLSVRNRNAGASNASKGKSSSGGGGSSKSDKPKVWTNPYDELYNLQEKINESLRTRQQLERQYDKLLKNRDTTSKNIIAHSMKEIDNLKQEIELQKQLLNGRRKQIDNIGNEKYENSDGDLVTFSSMGVTKYASYNEVTKLIQIDWDAINKVTDEEKGKAIEAYISKLEELVRSFEDTQDTILDIEDLIEDIQERNKGTYLDFEQTVFDALVNQRQKVIDEFQEFSDKLDEQNNNILDTLQESIDLERQIRDNTKTEEEIADKEQRLAYLKRDTSGANQMEIMKLEKEIQEARENYQDRLVDQAVDQMRRDNEAASKQRERQIELMQNQLDQDKDNGVFWSQVESLLEGAVDDEGNFKEDSELMELLQTDDNFKGMSYFGKKNWVTEMAKEWLQAMEGRNNFQMEEARERGWLDLIDGTRLNYDKETDTWKDAKGNTYSDVAYDLKNDSFTGKNNNDAKKTTNTTPSAPSSGEGSYQAHGYFSKVGAYDHPVRQMPGKEVQFLRKGLNAWLNSNLDPDRTDYNESVRKAVIQAQKKLNEAGAKPKLTVDGYWGKKTFAAFNNSPWKSYKSGGLADFTGPAWLDGTKTKPELVLKATDTKNFLQLKDVLAQLMRNGGLSTQTTQQSTGDVYFDINIDAEIDSDYDVDQLVERIKQQIVNDSSYRNINTINWIR